MCASKATKPGPAREADEKPARATAKRPRTSANSEEELQDNVNTSLGLLGMPLEIFTEVTNCATTRLSSWLNLGFDRYRATSSPST
jgi:hypothetical protein